MMNGSHIKAEAFDFSWKFPGLVALYSGGFLLLLQLSPLAFIQPLAEATASATVFFWRLFSVQLIRDGFFLRLSGVLMEVTIECTAAHYMIIASSAVLAYPHHSIRYKFAGLPVIIVCILVLNLLRIGTLGLIAHYSAGLFAVVHTFLWQGLFPLLVIALWVLWVRASWVLSPELLRYCLLCIVSAAASYWFLALTLPYYAGFLAALAGELGRELFTDFPPDIQAEAGMIAYRVSGGWAFYRVSFDIMNTIAFCTLLITTASYSDKLRLVKKALTGFGLLFILHVGYVILYGIICVRSIDENTFGDLSRGAVFISPVLIWLLVTKLYPSK